jgi:cyclic dehypoxanthinyl futalosine synthase
VAHIEVSVLGMGKEIGELGLRCGADDINSVVLGEAVMRSQGIASIDGVERFIREAGFLAWRRTVNFKPFAGA